jgi:diguanylate cyclase (GGDEF)-like protein
VLAASAMTVAPLIYDGTSLARAGEVLARLVVWVFMAVIAHVFMSGVRRDRLERERGSRRAAALARLDQLTGLGNRRAFDETLRGQIEDARAEHRPLSVVVADVHNFKDINDRFGHLAGDHCLRSVATTLARETRRSEPAYRTYRWGGDEFAVILPGATGEDAAQVAGRLLSAIHDCCADPEGDPLRLECGCAELEPDMTAETLLDAADLSLTARRGRRNGLRAADAS